MILLLFRIYKRIFSPFLHAVSSFILGPGYGCKFIPTCSEYCEQSLKLHGFFKGGIFSLKRLLICHPLSKKSGWDPVPLKKNEACMKLR